MTQQQTAAKLRHEIEVRQRKLELLESGAADIDSAFRKRPGAIFDKHVNAKARGITDPRNDDYLRRIAAQTAKVIYMSRIEKREFTTGYEDVRSVIKHAEAPFDQLENYFCIYEKCCIALARLLDEYMPAREEEA